MKTFATGLLLLLAVGTDPQRPADSERLRYNPRERTEAAIADLELGDLDSGLEKLETASRLAPGDPLTAFNAGTGRLIAGKDGAATRLEEAAAIAPPELQAAIQYNLGNARLAATEAAAAIEAYKETLRVDPSHMDAKYNLEVAQRLLQEQQKQQQQNQDGDQEEQDQEQDQENQDQQQEQEQESPQPSQDQQDEQEQESSDQREKPLPDFENQQDMTAEQAAAILEAVENLEREQRRKQAAERARRHSRTAKDW